MDWETVLELDWWHTALFVLLIYVVYVVFLKPDDVRHSAAEPPEEQLEPMAKRDFRVAELLRYNGIDEKRILIAVCGKIFDVTRGRAFYGPDGAYGKLAGHDATRALSTMNVDDVKDEEDDVSDLLDVDLHEAKEWAQTFTYKYPMVGRLLKGDEEPKDYNGELAVI